MSERRDRESASRGEKVGEEERKCEEREKSGRVVTIRGSDYCCTVAEVVVGS